MLNRNQRLNLSLQKLADVPKEYYLKVIDKIRTTVKSRILDK